MSHLEFPPKGRIYKNFEVRLAKTAAEIEAAQSLRYQVFYEEMDAKRVLVNSGVGAREYYRMLGYRRVGAYMGKELG